jgi:hypothetical protein
VAQAARLMSTRGLLNLALLTIAGILVAVVALRPGLEQSGTQAAITAIDPQSVMRIELTRVAGESLHFIRTGEHWQIEGTPVLPADDFQVANVLALLKASAVRSYPVSSLDPAKLGLHPPQVSAIFDHTRLELGSTEAIDGLRYVRLGDTVYLVPDRYAHLLNAGASNFLQRQLLPDEAGITGLQLPELTLTRDDGMHWQIQPDNRTVSADDINALLQNWQHASALYVTHADKITSTGQIKITLQNRSEPLVFDIVSRAPDLVLARPDWGVQYHLTAETGAGLLALPEPAPVD